jgi:hypothetical protein
MENFSHILSVFIENSLFTTQQISIILKRLRNDGVPSNMSAGSYYRQVKQCRKKIKQLIYTLILLRSMKIIDESTDETLSRITNQNLLSTLGLSDICAEDTGDADHVYSDASLEDLRALLDKIITKLVRI